jgi:hypothetical protein
MIQRAIKYYARFSEEGNSNYNFAGFLVSNIFYSNGCILVVGNFLYCEQYESPEEGIDY